MKHWLLITALLLLLGAVPVFGAAAQEEETGSIAGRVINGTSDGDSMADIEVILEGVRHGPEATILPPQTTHTDAQGNFRFDGLSLSEGNSFFVFVTHGGVEYGSRDVTLTSEAPIAELEMDVYESTTSDEAIRVTLNHIVLEADPGARMLRVLEVVQVVNDGDRTYIGEDEDIGPQPTLRFSLPEGAVQLQVATGLPPQDMTGTEMGFADTTPLPPGERNVTPTYDLPYAETDLIFKKTLLYPTDRLAILVKDDGIEMESATLSGPEATEEGGKQYLLFTGESLPAGTPIEVSLSGLPTSASGGSGGIPGFLWPLLAVGLVVALGLAALFSRRRRRGWLAQAGDAQDLPAED